MRDFAPTRDDAAAFGVDPLAWLDAFARSRAGVRRMTPTRVAIGDPLVARAVLRNDGGWLADHSDFFASGSSSFGPRSAQIAVGRGGTDLLARHVRSLPLDALLADPEKLRHWPRAGNDLIERMAGGILCGAHRDARFAQLRRTILTARVFDRDRPVGWARRVARRFAFYRAVDRERERFERDPPATPRDMLDLLFDLGRDATTEKLLELYIAFNFAAVGSVGFALGWALYLTLANDARDHPPRHILTETLRLYPVAWLLSRDVAVPHALGGVPLAKGDELWVFPYAVHRHPDHWDTPERFAPERWRDRHERAAWLPFGAGEHTCAAVSLTFQMFEAVWTALFDRYRVTLDQVGAPAGIGAALASPSFTVRLDRRA